MALLLSDRIISQIDLLVSCQHHLRLDTPISPSGPSLRQSIFICLGEIAFPFADLDFTRCQVQAKLAPLTKDRRGPTRVELCVPSCRKNYVRLHADELMKMAQLVLQRFVSESLYRHFFPAFDAA